MTMIEAQGLTKYYGAHGAVRDISFTVAEGETVGFLGANGAGKSTTMRMLTGFIPPTSGHARIAGHDVQTAPLPARQHLGYLPENMALYTEMRVREFLDYRARVKNLSRPARRQSIAETMERCWISDVSHRIIGQLSKGYRQRVGLAGALLGDPRLLILDEPTVGLDPNQVLQARSLIQDMGRQRTVFLSTHILHEVELLCKRVIIIDQGRIVADGSTADLTKQYAGTRHLFLRLQAAADPTPALQALAVIESAATTGPDAEGLWSMELTCAPGSDPRLALAGMATEKTWLITEMRLAPVRLEDIFKTVTMDATRETA